MTASADLSALLTDAQAQVLGLLRDGSDFIWLGEQHIDGNRDCSRETVQELETLGYLVMEPDSTDSLWYCGDHLIITPAGLSALAQHEAQA